jgi:rhodanese-related sulfurtransferase
MPIERVAPDEACRRQGDGWTYVDVRTVSEFEAGHPTGAYNIPFLLERPEGMVPNPDFHRIVAATFPRDARLLIGCRSGNRSLRAAGELAGQGFASVVDVRGGYGGEADPLGGFACEGWRARGLPTTTTTEPGHGWAELRGSTP